MPFRFSALASGSSGNASLIEADGFGLLIDAGLGPRQLAARLADVGASWAKVHAVLLTHTHTDHWKDRTLEHLRRQKIPLYCHAEHQPYLRLFSRGFLALAGAGLVRTYEREQPFSVFEKLVCHPLEVSHDSVPTFGFRIEGPQHLFGPGWNVGYAADLGTWSSALAEAFADVDILAVEFNHDERLEANSGRPIELIDRVLGDYGHLSNAQAGAFVQAILERSRPGALRHLVQLHLSRECNRPKLAQAAAHRVLVNGHATVAVHTATQDTVGPILSLDPGPRAAARIRGVN